MDGTGIVIGTKTKQKAKRKPARRDDELWKGILADVFDDFLRFFFPQADELFDFKKKFVFLDKEFNRLFPPEANAAGVRFVDKLAKVYLKNGETKFILMGVKEILLDRRKREGIEEGIEKGERKMALEIARELKIEGLAVDFIARTTKLSEEEIEAL